MNTRGKAWVIALALALGLAGGFVRGAAAHPLADPLPPYQQPPSARFDITGTIGGSGFQAQIMGDGAFAGQDYQEDVSVTAPGITQTVTTSVIRVGGKAYIKVGGIGTSEESTWYAIDETALTGGQTPPSGMMSGVVVGPDPQYAAAYTVQQIGKDTIEGAATTEYQVDVDLPKLLTLLGSPPDAATTEELKNFTARLYMWIGDADSYLHRLTVMEAGTITSAGTSSSIMADLTITLRDFGAAITIAAPANAQIVPLTGPGTGSMPTMPGALPMGMSGLGSILPISLPGTTSTSGTMPGMPRTGAPAPGVPWPLLPAGVLCLLAGAWLRRRAAPVR